MVDVVCECFLLGSSEDRIVHFGPADDERAPTWTVPVGRRPPQDEVRRSAPVSLLAAPHSTSWRWDRRRIVLTFIAFPADEPPAATAHPVPVYLPGPAGAPGEGSVVAHAVRHVAFLLATDPSFRCPEAVRDGVTAGGHLPDVFRDLTP